jgi:hypothetical protein
MDTLRKEAIVGVTCWKLKSCLFKALVLPTFTKDTKILGGDLKNTLEGFQEVYEDAYDFSCQKVFFDYLSYYASQIWRTSHGIICSQAYYGLSTMACPPIPLLISQ